MNKIAEIIAQQIIQKTFLDNWLYWLLFALILIVATYFASRIGANAAERGKLEAVHSQLDDIVAHLKATTEAAKSVELALAHADWTTKEYTTIRRDKLEELLVAAYEVQGEASNYAIADHASDSVVPDTAAMNKCETISALYFPELHDLTKALSASYAQMIVKVIDAAAPLKKINNQIEQSKVIISSLSNSPNTELQELFNQTLNGLPSLVDARRNASDLLREEIIQAYAPVGNCVTVLSTAARELMKGIIMPREAMKSA
jgi:hypothetical protein